MPPAVSTTTAATALPVIAAIIPAAIVATILPGPIVMALLVGAVRAFRAGRGRCIGFGRGRRFVVAALMMTPAPAIVPFACFAPILAAVIRPRSLVAAPRPPDVLVLDLLRRAGLFGGSG
jgi:hypothetical protein